MKILPSKMDGFLDKIHKEKIYSALIYGEDEGVAKDRSDKIYRSLKILDPNLEKIYLSAEDGASVSDAISELFTDSFFGNKKLIFYHGVTATDYKLLENIEKTIVNSTPNGFLVLFGKTIDSKTKLVSLFNDSNVLVNVPCYTDDASGMEIIIKQKLQGYSFDDDTPALIAEKFKGNRSIALAEIDKLLLYKAQDATITHEDIEKALIDGVEENLYEMAINFASLDINLIERGLKQLGADGVPFSVIVGLFTAHLYKLEKMLENISEGSTAELEIQKERIHFKYVNKIKKQLKMWNKNNIKSCLDRLLEVELASRRAYVASDHIIHNFFILCILQYGSSVR